MTPNWLDRNLIRNPFSLTLCTKPAQLAQLQKKMRVAKADQVDYPDVGARVYLFSPGAGRNMVRPVIVVCVAESVPANYEPIQLAALLCHEAVHVVDEAMEQLDEKTPSSEFRAYSTQAVAQELMYEYARQKGHPT